MKIQIFIGVHPDLFGGLTPMSRTEDMGLFELKYSHTCDCECCTEGGDYAYVFAADEGEAEKIAKWYFDRKEPFEIEVCEEDPEDVDFETLEAAAERYRNWQLRPGGLCECRVGYVEARRAA